MALPAFPLLCNPSCYPRDPNHYPDVIAPGIRANFPRNILNDPARRFSPRDAKTLQTMIAFGIEANPKIIEVCGLRPPSSRTVVRSAINHDGILASACVRQKQQRGPNAWRSGGARWPAPVLFWPNRSQQPFKWQCRRIRDKW